MNLRCFAFGVASFLFLQATSVAQQEMFFDFGGVRIRYLEAGKGLPVVLVHGQGSSADGNEWGKSSVCSALAREYRVIAFDMRGHGKSAKPRDPKTQELDDREAEREKEGQSHDVAAPQPPGTVITEEEFRRRSAAALSDPTQDRFAVAAQVRARRNLVVPPETAATLPMPILGVVASAEPAKVLLDAFAKVNPRMKLVVIEGATHAVQNGPPRNAAYNRPEFLAAISEFLSTRR